MQQAQKTDEINTAPNFRHYFFLLLVVAIGIRATMLWNCLSYDELWTIENFSHLPTWRILTDLSLPNNHPLNTLFIKLSCCFDNWFFIFRLHSFFAGLISVYLLYAIIKNIFQSEFAGMVSALIWAITPPAVCYSTIARGYSLQVMALQLVVYGLILLSARPTAKKAYQKWLPEVLIVAGVLTSLLAIPGTSYIFLGTIGLAAIVKIKYRNIPAYSYVIGLATIIIALAYFIIIFPNLQQASSWSTPVNSLKSFLNFSLTTLRHLVPWAAFPCIFLAIFLQPAILRKLRWAIGLVVVILISAIFTGGGPERAYLPLAAVFAGMAGALGQSVQNISNNKAAKSIFLLVLLIICGWDWFNNKSFWETPDYRSMFAEYQNIKPDTLVILPATCGYPLVRNCPDITEMSAKRLSDVSKLNYLYCQNIPSGLLNGMTPEFTETTCELPQKTKFHKLSQCELDAVNAGQTVILIIPAGHDKLPEWRKLFPMELNPWLRTANLPIILAGKCPDASKFPSPPDFSCLKVD